MTQPPRPPDSTPRAILLVLVSLVVFSISDGFAKVVRETLPATEVAWLRYLVFVPMALALGSRYRSGVVEPRRPVLQVLRAVAVLGSSILFIIGLGELAIAEATAIAFVAPIFVTALSVIFLGEQVGIRRWSAVAVGFVGVLIIIRPTGDAVQWAMLYPVGSAFCWAVALVVTRRMGVSERSETTLLWTACIGFAVLSAIVPHEFIMPTWRELGFGLALGLFSSMGQYMVILAYRQAPASVLAPFQYLQLLSSAALGYVLFGALPDAMTWVGAAVIVASGLYTAHRQQVRAKERALPPPEPHSPRTPT